MNYYNEFDPKAAAWLRQLIADGLIPPGDVDERSIEDVRPDEVRGYTQCHWFAGISGWARAFELAGATGRAWTGSCPCQPFSAAGKGAGFADQRHLWPAFYHLIAQCRPPIIFGEQVASGAARQWLDLVSADLENSGYAVGAANLCAAGIGAPHIRQRLYWVGVSDSGSQRGQGLRKPESISEMRQGGADWPMDLREVYRSPYTPGAGYPQPLLRRDVDGIPNRVVRLSGYGNAIIPQVAAQFIRAVMA